MRPPAEAFREIATPLPVLDELRGLYMRRQQDTRLSPLFALGADELREGTNPKHLSNSIEASGHALGRQPTQKMNRLLGVESLTR